jgi:hypothetical protein
MKTFQQFWTEGTTEDTIDLYQRRLVQIHKTAARLVYASSGWGLYDEGGNETSLGYKFFNKYYHGVPEFVGSEASLNYIDKLHTHYKQCLIGFFEDQIKRLKATQAALNKDNPGIDIALEESTTPSELIARYENLLKNVDDYFANSANHTMKDPDHLLRDKTTGDPTDLYEEVLTIYADCCSRYQDHKWDAKLGNAYHYSLRLAINKRLDQLYRVVNISNRNNPGIEVEL